MRKFILILTLFASFSAVGQETAAIQQTDSLVLSINAMASKGQLDTLRGDLLQERNTVSEIFFLREEKMLRKITVVNKQKGTIESHYLVDLKPVFSNVSGKPSSALTLYFAGGKMYVKQPDGFSVSDSKYWRTVVDSYINLYNMLKNQ
jgi:hypothetical protein